MMHPMSGFCSRSQSCWEDREWQQCSSSGGSSQVLRGMPSHVQSSTVIPDFSERSACKCLSTGCTSHTPSSTNATGSMVVEAVRATSSKTFVTTLSWFPLSGLIRFAYAWDDLITRSLFLHSAEWSFFINEAFPWNSCCMRCLLHLFVSKLWEWQIALQGAV